MNNLADVLNSFFRLCLSALKLGMLLSICSALLFAALGIAMMAKSAFNLPVLPAPVISTSLPASFWDDLLAAEIPFLPNMHDEASSLSAMNISRQLLFQVTNYNPNDTRSMLAATLPSMSALKPVQLYQGNIEPHFDFPIDSSPPTGYLLEEEKAYNPDRADSLIEEDAPAIEEPAAEEKQSDLPRKGVLIYHSHNRESWLPELPGINNPNLAYHSKINVTLLGKRLASNLESKGIGAVLSAQDYLTRYKKDFKYEHSYAYSEKTVAEAFAVHPSLRYVFDIHRDYGGKNTTTVTVDDTDYAQVYFIIGTENPDWQENWQFAKKINDLLNERVPGIAKGIYNKSHKDGDGEYNQHLSPASCLIEIGGVENSLEESYRTVDLLADIIAEMYWQSEDADKVSASVISQLTH